MGVVSQRLVPRVGGGRVAAFEVMIANDAMRNLIREGKTRQLRNVVATTSVEGMYTIESSLDFFVQTNQVSYADAVSISQYPREIKDPGIVDPLTTEIACGADDGCRHRSHTSRSPGWCPARAAGWCSRRG